MKLSGSVIRLSVTQGFYGVNIYHQWNFIASSGITWSMNFSICFLSFYLKYPFFVLYFLKCKQHLLITSEPGRGDCFSKSWPVSYSSHQTLCCPHHIEWLRNNANVRSSDRAIAIISSLLHAPSTGSLWAAVHRISTIMAQIEGGVEKRWYSANYVRT